MKIIINKLTTILLYKSNVIFFINFFRENIIIFGVFLTADDNPFLKKLGNIFKEDLKL